MFSSLNSTCLYILLLLREYIFEVHGKFIDTPFCFRNLLLMLWLFNLKSMFPVEGVPYSPRETRLYAKSLIPVLIFQTEYAESTHAHSESCHASLTLKGCVLLLSNSFHQKSQRRQFCQMEKVVKCFAELLLFKQRKFNAQDKHFHLIIELDWS